MPIYRTEQTQGRMLETSEWPKPVVLRVDEASQMPGGQLCRVNTYNTGSIPSRQLSSEVGERAQSGLVRWCALLSKCAQLEAVLDSTRRGRYLVKLLPERHTVERSRYASGYMSCSAFRGFSD